MQWRMLARRCPSGSMTLVGDFGQASRPGAPRSWDDVLANLPVRTPPHRVMLTVNYRTPAEIMDVANRLLPAAAPGVEPARPVRSTGADPEVLDGAPPRHSCAAAAASARDAATRGGTVAVIAPVELHADLAGRAGRPRRGGRRRRGDRRADCGAVRARLQGPRVRPRGRGGAGPAGRAPTAPACACSTSCSPGPRVGWSWCTPTRCPKRSTWPSRRRRSPRLERPAPGLARHRARSSHRHPLLTRPFLQRSPSRIEAPP